LVYDAHEYEIHRTQTAHPSRIWLNKQMEKFFIDSADAVITVSDSIAKEYTKLYRIDMPHLIYNCPALSMSDDKKYDIFREKFQINPNQKIFLYQGSFTKGRGVEIIIKAFSQMNDNKNVVVFMGYGPYLSKVKEAAKSSENIFYHEAVSINEIEKHSKSADWGLLTIENVSESYNLSLPNKLFEYAMAEIPILAFPTIEIKSKINEFKIGFCTENESVESLIDAIYKASKINKSQFKPGLKLLKSEFNWEKQEEKLIKIYKNL
jgi:glycosyltransferase involved in cell wall biosynthesis